jgi:hypothetical protein
MVVVGKDQAGFVAHSRRCAPDQIEQTVAARRDIRAMLKVVRQKFLEEGPSRSRGQCVCFAVGSMRELECMAREARNVIATGRQKISELLMRNVWAENPKMNPATVCDLVSVFFSGISIEANFELDPSVAREKGSELHENAAGPLRSPSLRPPGGPPRMQEGSGSAEHILKEVP